MWQEKILIAKSDAEDFARHIWYVYDMNVIAGTDGSGKSFCQISILLGDEYFPKYFFRITEHHKYAPAWSAMEEFEVAGDRLIRRGYCFNFSQTTNNIHAEHRLESYVFPSSTQTFIFVADTPKTSLYESE